MHDRKHQGSNIAKWYTGKHIFITGVTGFIGKVLLEKLLRSCPDVARIYLLIRRKKNLESDCRFKSLFEIPLFDLVRNENPKCFEKVVLLEGDLSKLNLGLKEEDINNLVENVSVIFHAAATVKFDEPLKYAVNVNIIGTQQIVDLCYRMKNIQAFVYVSTAFSNCDKELIEEKVYDAPADLDKLLKCVDCLDEDMLQMFKKRSAISFVNYQDHKQLQLFYLTCISYSTGNKFGFFYSLCDLDNPQIKLIIKNKPNVYCFTKAMAESIIWTHSINLPMVIVRPSIVASTWIEPVPGWIDTLNGSSGLFLSIGKGILRNIPGNHNYRMDTIPVDMCVNILICSAWYTSTHSLNKCIVYNCNVSTNNPIIWQKAISLGVIQFRKNPLENIFWYPNVRMTSNVYLYQILNILLHILPAKIVDFVLKVCRREPILSKLQMQLDAALSVLSHFTLNQWTFRSDNVTKLYQSLSDKDTQIFNFDFTNIDWIKYTEDFALGIKKYIIKEDIHKMADARKRLKILKWLYYLLPIFMIIITFGIVLYNWDFVLIICYYIYELTSASFAFVTYYLCLILYNTTY